MEWFEGAVAEAISAARNENKLMAIYVYGENPDSEQVTSALSAPMLAPLVPQLVALRLKQPSTELTQFSQIYPVLLVPSIYLISPQNGVALEVLAGPQSADGLLEKISNVLKKDGHPQQPPATAAEATATATVTSVPSEAATPAGENVADERISETMSTYEVAATQPTSMETETVPPAEPTMTPQEKVERAQRLIEAVRIEKAEAEKAEEQRKEIERREAMKNLQKIRREVEDREMKDFVAKKNKEREEEKRYKAQLQEQIRQDRLERQLKYSEDKEMMAEQKRKKEALEKKQEEVERVRALNASSANILFRMPDGSTVTHQFDAETLFYEVRHYIAEAKNLSSCFNLALNFPRRVFESDCDDKTLRELSLAPSAVLLVIAKSPSSQTNAGSNSGGAVMAWRNVWEMLTLPFTLAMGFFTSFFAALFPSTLPPPPPVAAAAHVQAEGSAPSTSAGVPGSPRDAPGASRARVSGTGSSMRQRKPYERSGNIHRLNTDNDDSDENNTWNGNSTQQM